MFFRGLMREVRNSCFVRQIIDISLYILHVMNKFTSVLFQWLVPLEDMDEINLSRKTPERTLSNTCCTVSC